MAQNCTILCPVDDPTQVLAVVRDVLEDSAEIGIRGSDGDWSAIEIKTIGASLTLNRQVRREPGDPFSKMVLGMHNYFRRVTTPAQAVKKDVLHRVANLALAIGVVAEPEFVEAARHYACIFAIADALDAIIWIGNGVINPEEKLLLDGEGNCEVA